MQNIKLTKCGCEECEEKAEKLLKWVNNVMNKYPATRTKRKKCINSLKISSVPMKLYY